MKERFEIVPCERRKHAVHCKRLRGPKQKWSEERSKNDDRDEIERQFSYVFQAC
jgi:hypothetical protein